MVGGRPGLGSGLPPGAGNLFQSVVASGVRGPGSDPALAVERGVGCRLGSLVDLVGLARDHVQLHAFPHDVWIGDVFHAQAQTHDLDVFELPLFDFAFCGVLGGKPLLQGSANCSEFGGFHPTIGVCTGWLKSQHAT